MSLDEDPTLPPNYAAHGARRQRPPGSGGPSIATVRRRTQQHLDELRDRRYRKPSLLMEWLMHFDTETYAHCVRVADLAFRVGEAIGLERVALRRMERAALIHDAGKLCVPLEVLNKAESLTEPEWAVMQQHAVAGESICMAATNDPELAALVRHHHERLDGGGYPDRLDKESISISVRILQLADIYDALTTHRAYKPAFTRQRALAIIDEEVEYGWRDGRIAAALSRVVN